MLAFSAITPHPPFLIPGVGKDKINKIKKTQSAMEKLARDFELAKTETVIIISPHGELMENAFTINTSPEFTAHFKEFGDLETELNFKGDVGFAYSIKEALETKFDIQMIADKEIDHGVSVPASILLKNNPDMKIIPFGYCSKNIKEHFELGQKIAEIIHGSEKRVAVIASGDLSHCVSEKSPVKKNPVCKNFDKEIVEFIKNKDIEKILNFDEKTINDAHECGLKSIIILMGILTDQNVNPEILSYESPLGIGYLVCSFQD
jgi:AmmeMemoRadiSam system protein B